MVIRPSRPPLGAFLCILLAAAWILVAGPGFAAPVTEKADRIVVVKSERRLDLMKDGTVLESYQVALGKRPTGPKTRQGDGRTPEGKYVIDRRNANSKFHRALHISYPNAEDKARAKAAGVSPGGAIFIHGVAPALVRLGARHAPLDWTDGCIAVTNPEIDEIWAAVDDGTPIEIRP